MSLYASFLASMSTFSVVIHSVLVLPAGSFPSQLTSTLPCILIFSRFSPSIIEMWPKSFRPLVWMPSSREVLMLICWRMLSLLWWSIHDILSFLRHKPSCHANYNFTRALHMCYKVHVWHGSFRLQMSFSYDQPFVVEPGLPGSWGYNWIWRRLYNGISRHTVSTCLVSERMFCALYDTEQFFMLKGFFKARYTKLVYTNDLALLFCPTTL